MRDVEEDDLPALEVTTCRINFNCGGEIIKYEDVATYVGYEVTATAAQMASFKQNDKKYIYVSGNETITAAQSGNVINLVFREAETWSYTVTSNLGIQVATGTNFEGETITYGYPHYQLKDNILYKKGTTNNEYRSSFTLDADEKAIELTGYASSDEKVVYYSEAENIEGSSINTTGTNVAIRSSNAAVANTESPITLTTLYSGQYTLILGNHITRNNKIVTSTFSINGNSIVGETEGTNAKEIRTVTFDVNATGDFIWVSSTGDGYMDYVGIQQNTAGYTVKFVDESGNKLKDDEVAFVAFDTEVSATDAQKADFFVNGTAYTYKSGDETITAEFNKENVITLVFSKVGSQDITSTYITNADFSSTDGWTAYVSDSFKDYGNGLIGTYGVRTAEGQAVSTVDETHLATEYCFGFEVRWSGNYASFNQTTSEMPAGKYTLTYDVENTNSNTSKATYNNLFYVQVGETKYTDSSTEWMAKGKSSWTTHTQTFTLTTASTAIISLGYGTGSNNIGSANTPTLHVSHLKLTYENINGDVLERLIAQATSINTKIGTLTSAISAAQTALNGINNTPAYQATIDGAITTLQTAINDAIDAYDFDDNGDDVTALILRPGFEDMTAITEDYGTVKGLDYASEGWTLTTTGDWAYGAVVAYGSGKKLNGAEIPAADNNANSGNALGVSVGWEWSQIYQSEKIRLVPGTYVLKVNAYNGSADAQQMTSKLGFVPTSGDPILSTKTSFNSNTWVTDEVTFTLDATTEGRIQIGGQAISGGSGANAKVFFDNITLTYYDPLVKAQLDWQEVHDALAALDATALPDAAEAAITTELAKAVPTTTVEDVQTAQAGLQALIDSYDGIKAAYDKVLALITKATSEKTNSTGTKDDIEAAISTATTNIETRTAADDLASDYTTLETARETYVLAAQPTAGYSFDYTFKIADAAVTSKDSWTNATINSGQQYTGAPDNTYLDVYDTNSNIQQVIGTLGIGRYELTVATRGEANVTVGNIYVSQNGANLNSANINHVGSSDGDLGNGWSWTTFEFTNLDTENDLTIGFYSECGSNKWAGADDFRLTYLGNNVTEEAAEAILASVVTDKMNADVAAAQTAAKETFEAEKNVVNYAALQTAIANAETSAAAYASAAEKLAQMKTLTEQTNVYTADAYAAYYTTPKGKYDDNSMTNDEANALQNPFAITGWHAAVDADNFLLSAWNTAPDFDGENSPYYINTWSTEGNTDGSGMTTPFFEYFVNNGAEAKLAERTLTATMTGVAAGNYYVDVLVRLGKNSGEDEAPTGITLDVNGGAAVDLCTGAADKNGRFYGTFRAFGTVGDDGNLAININVAAENNVHWLAFKNVVFDVFTGATEEQKTDLADAITDAEAKTLGFEKNEYAPYNNIAAQEALAAAKAINTETATGAEVVAATTALTGATWTQNETDVDAVYNGLFATVTEGANYPNGWQRTNGWGQMLSGIDGDYATAYYNQPGSLVYGTTGYYTMPLAENTVYELTVVFRSHENNSNNAMNVSVLNETEEGLARVNLGYNKSTTDWKVAKKLFRTGIAGNYVLKLENDGNTWMTGVSLVKAEAENITIAEDETYTPAEKYANVTFNRTLVQGWNGLVLPFDMTVENVATTFNASNASKVKNFTGITYDEAKGVTLNFANFAAETVIPAGTPFLVKTNAAGTSYTINGVLLPATGLQNITWTADGNDNIQYTMKGTHAASTDLTDVSFALIQGNTFFYHDGTAAKASSAKAFRAYFENESEEPAAARVSFDFGDGETTGITELAQPKTAADGTAYDLQGRKVENFKQKGIYIVNGRKVVK